MITAFSASSSTDAIYHVPSLDGIILVWSTATYGSSSSLTLIISRIYSPEPMLPPITVVEIFVVTSVFVPMTKSSYTAGLVNPSLSGLTLLLFL